MSALTVYPSSLTHTLQSLIDKYIRDCGISQSQLESINIANYSENEIVVKLNEEFNRLVTINSEDSTLHIISLIPVFEKESNEQIEKLIVACSKLEHNLTLHLIGLCQGLSGLFEKKGSREEQIENQNKAEEKIIRSCGGCQFPLSYTFIDDYAENGTNIGFTLKSLARYIALIELALTRNYYSILSPALLGAHQGNNISLGISSLSFNKAETVRQLLGMAFLASLDKVGINETEVDAQKASHEAELFLVNIAERYPNLYNNSIRPLYRERGMTEGKAVAEASEVIKNDLEQLRGEIITLLKDENFSLPEKEAILAMILGRDNRNLHGVQYEHEGTILDDICDDSINLYVDAYNEYCKDKNLLPVRGDFEALQIKIWNEEEGTYEDVPENHEALNPLPEIKRLKQQILNTTSFLREKREELEGLQKSSKIREDADEVRKLWHKPEGDLKDFEYKEQPLDEKYVPNPRNKIKETVDLRDFFPPVRNQKDLGSCTSFAVTAMYEGMMARGGIEDPEYLSPGYLFYYSNILKGRPQGGSNFHDQLEVMGTHGVCLDNLYTYDAETPSRKPSKEAEEDAKKHRVLKAKQIVLSTDSDKAKEIKKNHTSITSALSEGYPVGISLKVYDNLGKDGPFIHHPSETPNAKEEGYHAMVIAGYSESNGFYIVRNSWGPDFGEDGYCYVPTTYIDDGEYLDFACIITEITDTSEGEVKEIPTVLANFAATETEIRIAALRNEIPIVKLELQEYQKLYADYYKYYQKLMLRLTMPKVQNDIRKEAEIGQTKHIQYIEEYKHNLENSFVAKLKEYKKSLQKVILSLLGTACIFGIVWYYTQSVVMMILFIVAAGLGVLVWLGYKWWVRLKRRSLQEQLDEVAVNAKRQADKLMEMQIKFHVAGMWLSSFHKLSLEIGITYDRLVSFNDTLREWQKDYSRQVEELETPEGLMFRTIDASNHLNSFFDAHKDDIVNRIDLLKVFRDYQANVDDLEISRNNLHQEVSKSIEALMTDFNIVNFLLGDSYSYLSSVNLQEEMDKMIQLGQPSFRNKARNATSPVRLLMANVELSRSAAWTNAVTPFFPLRPVFLSLDDPNIVILLTLHPQSSIE